MARLCVVLLLLFVSNVTSLGSHTLDLGIVSSASPEPPSSVDWVSAGAVGRVRDHRSTCCNPTTTRCSGGSWAYATASAVESVTKIVKGGKLVDLSARQLIDCDSNNFKCVYGAPYDAFYYVKENGLKTACEYASNAVCSKGSVKIDGYDQLPQEYSGPDGPKVKEKAMMVAVARSPVTAQIDGTNPAFKNYTGGIYTGPCDNFGSDLSVVIVGYGSEGGKNYWKIRNSWGISWGEGGYMRLERGYTEFGGRCGIRGLVAYPSINTGAAMS